MEHIAERLIASCPELEWLADHRIGFVWRKKGGSSRGTPVYGRPVLASGMLKHFRPNHEAFVWLAADNVALSQFTKYQVEALLYSLLLHFDEKAPRDGERPGRKRQLVILGPEWSGFREEIERYGWWTPTLADVAEAVQTRLLGGDPVLVSPGRGKRYAVRIREVERQIAEKERAAMARPVAGADLPGDEDPDETPLERYIREEGVRQSGPVSEADTDGDLEREPDPDANFPDEDPAEQDIDVDEWFASAEAAPEPAEEVEARR